MSPLDSPQSRAVLRSLGLGVLLIALLAGCAAPAASESEIDAAKASEVQGEALEPSPGEPAAPASALEPGPAYVNLGAEAIADPASVGVGRKVPSVEFTDIRGERHSFSTLLKGSRGLVVVFSTLGCPVCKNYHASLEGLAQEVEALGARFLLVDPSIQDTEAKLRGKSERLGWTFRVAQDPLYQITDALSATRTTATFVIDAEGVVRYHGALDDQYGINYRLDAPRNAYLRDALEAVLAGREVLVPATTAPGCRLSRVVLPSQE